MLYQKIIHSYFLLLSLLSLYPFNQTIFSNTSAKTPQNTQKTQSNNQSLSIPPSKTNEITSQHDNQSQIAPQKSTQLMQTPLSNQNIKETNQKQKSNNKNSTHNAIIPTKYKPDTIPTHQSTPYIIIDCGKKESIYKKKCFRVLNYIQKRLEYSGKFKKIFSMMNLNFLYKINTRKRIAFGNFSEKAPYRHKKRYFEVMEQYKNLYADYTSADNRYILIRVIPIKKLPTIESHAIRQITVSLDRKKIAYYYFTDKRFATLYEKLFNPKSLLFSIKLSKDLFYQNTAWKYSLYKTIRKIKSELEKENEVLHVNTPVDFAYFLCYTINQEWKEKIVWSKLLTYHELLPDIYHSLIRPLENQFFIDVRLKKDYDIYDTVIQQNIQKLISFNIAQSISKETNYKKFQVDFINAKY